MKKTIIIAGCNGRIGHALLKNFLDKGHNVIAVDKIFSKTKSIKNKNLYKIKLDLSKEDNIKIFFKKIMKLKNNVTGFVYCLYPRSKNWGKKFELLSEKDIKNNIFFQLGLPILFLKNLYSFLKGSKNKISIILISSIQGIKAPKFEHYKNLKINSPIEYSACKAGIISITSYLTKYYKNKNNIRINCISPGGIRDNQNKIFQERYRKSCVSKGLLDPQDLLGVINFLIDNSSEFIRGQNIIIDDGWSL